MMPPRTQPTVLAAATMTFVLAAAFVLAASAARADATIPTHEDVAYGAHERNVFDLWLAESDRPTPLLIFIHGGGFRQGDKASVRGRPVVEQCLESGVSFASLNYRFLEHAGISDILRDAARAVQYIRGRAGDWNIDPERIACYGSSAGAGTSMWLAFHDDLADPDAADPVLRQSSRLAAAGSLDGQVSYDLRDWASYVGASPYERSPGELRTFYGFKSEEESSSPAAEAIMKDCSMIHLISNDDPPVAIACSRPGGESVDRAHYVHHPQHSTALAERCKEHQVECLLVLHEDTPARDEQAARVVQFLIDRVKAPK